MLFFIIGGEYMREIMIKIGKISFSSFDEIYEKKDKAREMYKNFDQDTKEVYKWYYYHQLCIMKCSKKEPLKDYLWLYIAGVNNLSVLKKEYNKFYKKNKKIREREAKEPIQEEQIDLFDIFWFMI